MCTDGIDLGYTCRLCGKSILFCAEYGPSSVCWHKDPADGERCRAVFLASSTTVDDARLSSTCTCPGRRLAGPTRVFVQPYSVSDVRALRLKPVQTKEADMDRFKKIMDAATGEMLWAIILIPILTISWLGFYTIARSIGIPPIFAAGMSAAFDGIALFAARIGLRHRRKGFSGYLARITVIAFAALGAFVQSFHSETHQWIQAHSWIVWATAPVAAVLAYELHLGWVHRKQLIRKGYVHPSAKSGFGPATWLVLGGTWGEYRKVLRARRDFIAAGNLARFQLEDAQQPAEKPLPVPIPAPRTEPLRSIPPMVPMHLALVPMHLARTQHTAKSARLVKSTRPEPVRSSHTSQPARKSVRSTTESQRRRAWAIEHGFKLGHNGRVPIEALNAYRAAMRASGRQAQTAA